jgi:hypothetical protein
MADAAYIVSLTVLKRGAPYRVCHCGKWYMIIALHVAWNRGHSHSPPLAPRDVGLQWHDNERWGGDSCVAEFGGQYVPAPWVCIFVP